jgi:triosephosphate isomerase
VAYEPVWAIGAAKPAPVEHIRAVAGAVRDEIRAGRPGSIVIYGGSAGPGLLSRIGGSVDGLFLGRFAHDVDNLAAVLDEAAALAARRRGEGSRP